jgi:Beta-lactamase class C and other penicillin binding proteins
MFKKLLKSSVAILVAFTMVLLPNSFASAQTAADYTDVQKQAQTKADLLTSAYGETSIQYALIDNGKIIVSGQSGLASKETNTTPTKDTIYGIGSVSKVYTTAAVMQLVEQGKVNLDTSVVKYLPEFKMADARYKDITVRMLLNHSSGIMGTSSGNASLYGDNDTYSMDHLLKELATQRLKADPGAYSVYCNDGFSLAQLLVEKVSGISFSEYINKNIAAPLSLSSTKTPLDKIPGDLLARIYSMDNKVLPTDTLNMIGAGGIFSTAEDVCHFAEIFMNNRNTKLLSVDSVKAMAQPEYLNGFWYKEGDASLAFGLGWDCVNTYPFTQYGIKALYKGGDTSFYHASLYVLPENNMAMAVLSSGGSSTMNQLFAQSVLVSALYADGSIKEVKAEESPAAPVKADMPAAMKDYSGFYGYYGGIFRIEISEDGVLKLYSTDTSKTAQNFIYTGDGKFYTSDGSGYVSFQKESNGNTYFYASGHNKLPNIGTYAYSEYQGEKISDNMLSETVKAAWDKRENKKYFLLNEKYSSVAYSGNGAIYTLLRSKGIEGYFGNAKIMDENTAETMLQIPGNFGRDLLDTHFETKNKVEYLSMNGIVFGSENVVEPLSTKSSFQVKMGSDGYVKWFKVSSKAKNKKIKVTIPNNASFTVYDADGNCLADSWITGKNTVTLQAGGYLVFAGNADTEFTVKYVK